MKSCLKIKILTITASIAVAGSAWAQMNLDSSGGSIFLNVYDTVNGNSFSFDTGLKESTLGSSFSVSVASDPNYQAFTAAEGAGDTLLYDVLAIDFRADLSPKNVYSTDNGTVSAVPSSGGVANAGAAGAAFVSALNSWSPANNSGDVNTGVSAFVNSTTAGANVSQLYPALDTQLGISDLGPVGTALNFYVFLAINRSNSSVSQFAATWYLSSAGLLTYSPVPLPSPVYLLLCGLGVILVVTRRRSSALT